MKGGTKKMSPRRAASGVGDYAGIRMSFRSQITEQLNVP